MYSETFSSSNAEKVILQWQTLFIFTLNRRYKYLRMYNMLE
jgi:hypothetical protein